jgi:NAD(P)H-hydrate epimerase
MPYQPLTLADDPCDEVGEPMMESWTLERIRRVDRIAVERFAMPSLILMENAGRGAADWIAAEWIAAEWIAAEWIAADRIAADRIAGAATRDTPVIILCGTGNNGGDGLVIARHLHAASIPVGVWIFGDPARMTPDTAANLAMLSKTRVACLRIAIDADDGALAGLRQAIGEAEIVIDALLGTGATGSPRGAMARAIEAANAGRARRFAIDIPSGLEGRTGNANPPTFRAEVTLTFVASKIGFQSTNALPYVGREVVLPIGVPPEVIEAACAQSP